MKKLIVLLFCVCLLLSVGCGGDEYLDAAAANQKATGAALASLKCGKLR